MRRFHLAVVVVGLASAISLADVVTTSDGSKLVGTVEQVTEGRLVIMTDIAGRLEIDASKVTGISTDASVHVAVASGDTVVGAMETSGDGSIVHSQLGDITIAASSITHLWPDGAENPRIVAVREKAEAEIEAAKPKWSVVLEGGASRTDGNTDTLQGHGRLDVKRVTKSDLLHLYLAGKYAEQNDARTSNEYWGGTRYEGNVTDRWYWYARTELEYDEFEQIDLRATAAVGAGHYWLKQPDHELKTSVGVGYRHEAYQGGRTEDSAVLDLGLDYRLDIAPWIQLTHSTVYSPDFLEFADYRLRLDTALLIPFKNDRWAWKLGMRNEYNSQPQAGFDRLDNTYYTSIVLTLK